MSKIICPNCSTENAADSLKCLKCGASLPVEGNHLESISDWIDQIIDPEEAEPKASAPDEGDQLSPQTEQEETILDESKPEGPGDELLDWLSDLDPDLETTSPSRHGPSSGGEPVQVTDSLDEWAAELSSDQEGWIDDNDQDEYVKEPHSAVEADSDKAAPSMGQTAPLSQYHEVEGIPEQLASQSLPDWLQDEAADTGEFSADYGDYDTFDEALLPLEPMQMRGSEEDSSSEADFSEEYVSSEQDMTGDLAKDPDPVEDDWFSELAGIDVNSELDGMLETDQTIDEKASSDQSPEPIAALSVGSQMPPPHDEPVQSEDEESEPDVPNWLQDLKPEELAESDKDDLIESAGILAGIKGVLPLATPAPASQKTSLQVEYPMSVEQRRQVALLQQLTTVEQDSAPSKSTSGIGDRFLNFRIILGILLISVVTIGWFAPAVNEIFPGLESQPIPIETEKAITTIEEVAGKPVLVAFEYTPAYADELDPVAVALLEELASNSSAVVTISQYAAAVPITQRITGQVTDLDSSSLGYLPGDATGLRRLGSCLIDADSCETIPGLSIDLESQTILLNVSAIIVLTAERDSLVNWIEQVGTQKPVPIISGLTQALSPMAGPYLASNQLAGSLAGMPAAAKVAQVPEDGPDLIGKALNSLTLAQWLSVIVLVAGALYFGVFDLAIAGNKKVETK